MTLSVPSFGSVMEPWEYEMQDVSQEAPSNALPSQFDSVLLNDGSCLNVDILPLL